jgi:hypothetical protein
LGGIVISSKLHAKDGRVPLPRVSTKPYKALMRLGLDSSFQASHVNGRVPDEGEQKADIPPKTLVSCGHTTDGPLRADIPLELT